MEKFLSKLKRLIPSKRRLIQLYAALLVNANIKGFADGTIYQGKLKTVCTPGLNCYSCPGASGACPLGSLQNALSSSGKTVPYYIFGIILLYGIIFGRFICGFLCPFGLIQDLLHKIPTPKIKKNRFTKALSYLKYVILVFFVFIIPLLYMLRDFPLPGFCKYICPAGTLGGAISLLIHPANSGMFARLGPLFTWKFALLVSFIVGCVFIYRLFCRFFCPLGALYGLFNRFAILGIKLDKPSCTECGRCIKKCKMDISRVGDCECINCGECISECPTGAIQWRGGKILLPKNNLPENPSDEEKTLYEKKRRRKAITVKMIAGILALSLLGGALVYYNFLYEPPTADEAPTVKTVPDATFTALGGEQFTVHGFVGVNVITFIDKDDIPNSIDRLSELANLVRSVNPSADEDTWCRVVLLFTGCTAEEAFTNRDVPMTLAQVLQNPSIKIASDKDGAYHKRLKDLGEGDGIFIASKNKLLSAVLAEDSSYEDIKLYATLSNTDAREGTNEGDLCPTYALERLLSDGTVNLSEFKGKTVVLNFWYTECGPCVEELPHFNEVATEYKDKNVVVIAVHQYATKSLATREYFESKGWLDSDIIFAADGENEAYYQGKLKFGTEWPSTLIIDAKGVIYKKFEKKISKEQLTSAIDGAIASVSLP